MKIILTNEVSGLGSAGDIVEVRDGYARNYLVPRGFAIRWTKGGEKDVEQIRRARKIHEIATIEQANEVKGRLEGTQVRLPVRAGDQGRLFGSVTPADIASAVKDAGGPELDKRRIEVGNAIKTLGAHQVSVRLHADVTAKVDVEVVAA
ncbi:50S ribosomal protein L9 [Streptomyces sp. HNM0574]|uniref:50S ribosomal protein L9 n=1 Tax=Streptomyces sp. HNM0574 TaxID=2714954 RepID=UPI00146A8DC5|nr:50S ribosomal protein L9 [Streptomyces sp. HNM0574]NLU69543.1 50S ribosomal protein L9 [Streptomyces sp. HNM0574]